MKSNIFKAILIVFSIGLFSSNSFAQTTPNERKAEQLTVDLDKIVNLSTDQRTEIFQINLDFLNRADNISNGSIDQKSALKTDRKTQINGVLNNTQKRIMNNPLRRASN